MNRLNDRALKARQGRSLQFFAIPEVADLLQVSSRSVRRWMREGKLVAHRFGASVRIAEADLSAFIAQHRAS